MRRLVAYLGILAIFAFAGQAGAMLLPSLAPKVYLPAVSNVPSWWLTWQSKALYPTWTFYLGAAVTPDGTMYGIATYPTYDYGDGDIHAFVYSPSTDTWTMLPGRVPAPACGCYGSPAVASATNGKLYILLAEPSSNFEETLEYDPRADTWTTRAPMSIPLRSYGLVGATDGKLYAVGGADASGAASTALQFFDPASGGWSSGPAMPQAIVDPSVAATGDGKIYAFGDGVGEVYDTAARTWTSFYPRELVTYGMGAAQAADGKVYLVGGPPCSCPSLISSNVVWVYEPSTDVWLSQASIPLGLENPSVVVLGGYNLYVLGGWIGGGESFGVYEATIAHGTTSVRH